MHTIIIIENNPYPLCKTLLYYCSGMGGAELYSPFHCFRTSITPAFRLILTNVSAKIRLPGSIVLLGNCDYSHCRTDLTGCTAVTDRFNLPALRIAQSYHCDTISYSVSGNDTLTLSGSAEDSVLLSLRRSIITPDRILEPFDFLLKKQPDTPDEAILASAAVLLLCNAIKPDEAAG